MIVKDYFSSPFPQDTIWIKKWRKRTTPYCYFWSFRTYLVESL